VGLRAAQRVEAGGGLLLRIVGPIPPPLVEVAFDAARIKLLPGAGSNGAG
jgi:hypothetical protein